MTLYSTSYPSFTVERHIEQKDTGRNRHVIFYLGRFANLEDYTMCLGNFLIETI